MRAVIIRVSRASITIDGQPGGSMDKGFVVLVGVKPEDTTAEAPILPKIVPNFGFLRMKTAK